MRKLSSAASVESAGEDASFAPAEIAGGAAVAVTEGAVLVKGEAVVDETAIAVVAGTGGSAAGVVVAVTGAADEGGGTACGGATGGALWPTRQMIKPATSARASDNSSRSFMP
jgi:hypothetical protein